MNVGPFPAMRRLARILVGLVLAAAAAVLAWRMPKGVETDLHGLADSRRGGVLRAVAAGVAGQGRVLLEGDDAEALVEKAGEIAAFFGQRAPGDLDSAFRPLEGHTAGLLAPVTRELLRAGRFGEVANASAARLCGLAPPLFSVKGDPFLLATEWAESLQGNLADGWSLQDGYPVCERNGRVHLLMTLDLSGVDAARIAGFRARCAASGDAVRVRCCGAPFHSALAAERSRREVNVLSVVSLALVVLLGWLLFRSLLFVPELLAAQGAGLLVATAALFAAFPRPHVLTFVFGTSLIGLSVDYVYHARASGDVRRILRPLTLSLATTLACFAPLLLADVRILRQMALFTMAGLVAVYVVVVLWGRSAAAPRTSGPAEESAAAPTRGRWRSAWMWIVVLACAAGLWRTRIVDDPAAFYRPDPGLVADEKALMDLGPGESGRFAFVPGPSLQEALEREEAAELRGLSAVMPSLRRQRENAALVARLVAAEGAAYTAKTGLKMPQAPGGLLDPECLPDGPLARMVRAMHVAGGLVSPLPKGDLRRPGEGESWSVIEPRASLRSVFHAFTVSALRLLAFSLLAFAVLLAALLRGAALRTGMPVVLALVATAGLLGWLGIPVTFFTLVCFFVLAGLGIDYAIFHSGDPAPGTRRTVLFSFLTSFAGLGLLSFTDFPVTRAMGLTFAIGLSFAYGFSRILSPGGPRSATIVESASPVGTWHVQAEQSAGRVRLLFMWWVYRLLGKNVLKIVCIPVMAFIYPFASPAKRALRAFYGTLGEFNSSRGLPRPRASLFRHLLGFAWSLVDKTDACTLRRSLPKMSVADDDGWQDFRELIARRKGCFLISSHLGTIEVLPALAAMSVQGSTPPPRVHAFQQMGHDAVFTRMFMRHFDASAFTLHAVEEIGVGTAVGMQEAIGRGELVLMAGDRVSAGSGKTLVHDFLGRPCRWPKGVFTFAKLMESPVFFVVCVRTGWNAYTCRFRRFDDAAPGIGGMVPRMLGRYAAFLEEETRRHPGQWYQFYDFFGNMV